MTNCNLIIPTYNRARFLQRILDYYNRYGKDFNIIVADSSSDENKLLNKKIVSSFPNLEILYLGDYSKKVTPYYKFADAINHAKSKYIVFCPDDDFIVPSAIKECINFMEKNPDYSVVLGMYHAHLLKKRKNKKLEFNWTPAYYVAESIRFDNPFQRLKFHLVNHDIVTLFGIHRTDTMRAIYEEAIDTVSHGRLGEILLTSLTLIFGKMEILPIFYASREHSDTSVEKTYNSQAYFYLPWSSFFTHQKFDKEYKAAVACLAKNLQKQTSFDINESTKLAADALNGYLDPLRQRVIQKNRNNFRKLLKKILNKIRLLDLYKYSYIWMKNIEHDMELRFAKRRRLKLLKKNDPRFYENLSRIKEKVIESEAYIIK